MSLFRAFLPVGCFIAAAGAVLVATPGPAQAHICWPPPLSEYADDVEVAFVGRQIDQIRNSGDDYDTLLFEVEWVYKGETGALLEARTSAEPFYEWQFDPEIVGIAAYELDGRLTVDVCISIYYVPQIHEFHEVFGPGYPPGSTPPPAPPAPPPPPDRMPAVAIALLIWAAGFLLICGAAAVYHLRRRSGQGP